MSATFLALSGRMLWRLLERHQIDPAAVFRDVGLDPELMGQPRARYPNDRVVAALDRAEQLIGDPCLGLEVAKVWRPTDHHALGYAFCASSTLRTALQRFVRYFSIINESMCFSLDEANQRATISVAFAPGTPPYPRAAEDARWSILLTMSRFVHGDELAPLEVHFTHPAPPCSARFFGLFRCPVLFDAPASQLVFRRSDLDQPLPASNRELAHSNDRILTDYLAQLQHDQLINQVRTVLINELPGGRPSEETVAGALHMSARTLQRRLADENSRFSQLLDEVRHELAERYIEDHDLTIGEVSYLLGFSEVSSFSRAFRRWTGEAPSRYRNPLP